MLYLIGVNHIQQHESTRHNLSKLVRDKRAVFNAHVLEVIEKLDIAILAEEFNEEAKKRWGVSETTLEQIGKAKGIEYRPCDPDSIEKQRLGIEVDPKKETQSDRDKRERVWLSRIQDCKDKNVLFVCGDDHFKPFVEKLIAEGFDVKPGPRWKFSQDEQRTINYELWAAS
jgi:hypothetical protein